jgi:hypothetical protein
MYKLVVQNRLFKSLWAYAQPLSVWATSKWCYFDSLCEKYLKANKSQHKVDA